MIQIKSPIALGAVLRKTRITQQIRAEDLAAILETSPTTLRRLEHGAPPTAAIKTLFRLFDELGIELHVSLPPDIDPISFPDESPKRGRVRS